MSQFIVMMKQQIRLQRLSMAVWSIIEGLMSYGVGVASPAVVKGTAIEKMTKGLGMESLMGGGPTGYIHKVDWYVDFKLLSQLLLILGVYATLAVLGIVSREEDKKTSEFVLSLPVSRRKVIASRFGGTGVVLAIIHIIAFLSLFAGLKSTGLDGSFLRYAGALSLSFLLTLSMGAISLYISLTVSSYGKALRYSMGLLAAFFLYDLAVKMAIPEFGKGILGKLTPFGWYDTTGIIKYGNVPVGGIVASLLLTVIFVWLSMRRYDSREVNA